MAIFNSKLLNNQRVTNINLPLSSEPTSQTFKPLPGALKKIRPRFHPAAAPVDVVLLVKPNEVLDFIAFFQLLPWGSLQGGAPPVMWTLVYKPHEYYRYITYKA